MEPVLYQTDRCPASGVLHLAGRALTDPPGRVVMINGIGLDHEGFRDALQSLALPMHAGRYPYGGWNHLAVTVPGFEDALQRLREPLLGMDEQAERLASFLARDPVASTVIYGFSYGSDLAVEVLERVLGRVPVVRVVLAELNVRPESCFITRRMAESYEAALDLGQGRHQQAYAGFVSRVMRAYAEGRMDRALMQDMTLYFKTIARKDWHQLARCAREVSADPEARARRLWTRLGTHPEVPCELVFSDPKDLVAAQRLQSEHGAPENIHVRDATARGHFWHMSGSGVLDNLSRG